MIEIKIIATRACAPLHHIIMQCNVLLIIYNAHVLLIIYNAHVLLIIYNAHVLLIIYNAHVLLIIYNAHVLLIIYNAHVLGWSRGALLESLVGGERMVEKVCTCLQS